VQFKIENPEDATATGNASPNDGFGYSLAMEGDTALVGVPSDYTASGVRAGATYVYVRSGNAWLLQARLFADDGGEDAGFGRAVALTATTALIGARYDDTPAGVRSGSAYVFVRTGDQWHQQAKLMASDGAAMDEFGGAVALSGDTALVGADSGASPEEDTGSAYVFVRNGTSWHQQAELPAAGLSLYDGFGTAVAVSSDTALVGAPGSGQAGALYVFVRSGSAWIQQARLTPPAGSDDQALGRSVALSGDLALAGAPMYGGALGTASGAAYLFARGGTEWGPPVRLTASNGAAFKQFGQSVALSQEHALIVARDSQGTGDGSVYVFTRAGSGWTEQVELRSGTFFTSFGVAVAVSGDTALVGAPDQSTTAGTHAGSAHV